MKPFLLFATVSFVFASCPNFTGQYTCVYTDGPEGERVPAELRIDHIVGSEGDVIQFESSLINLLFSEHGKTVHREQLIVEIETGIEKPVAIEKLEMSTQCESSMLTASGPITFEAHPKVPMTVSYLLLLQSLNANKPGEEYTVEKTNDSTLQVTENKLGYREELYREMLVAYSCTKK